MLFRDKAKVTFPTDICSEGKCYLNNTSNPLGVRKGAEVLQIHLSGGLRIQQIPFTSKDTNKRKLAAAPLQRTEMNITPETKSTLSFDILAVAISGAQPGAAGG
ncbi:hypothetical protein AMECASPLE_022332 [Ameca splendens]|uniref:Uncharacterized protein n=1 Tax=Ameca splendens TaxID=208324 RepID=A0ABV0YQN8_9TELE